MRPVYVLIVALPVASALLVSSGLRCNAPKMTLAPDSEASTTNKAVEEEDWSELDAWLAEGSHEVEKQFGPSIRPNWSATSAGHQHEHFHPNGKLRDWSALGASPRLVRNLKARSYEVPSMVQANVFGNIIKGDSMLIADANGVGKSLAFVAPLVERLWELEASEGKTPKGQVRAIVVVPTAELGRQVLELARDVAKGSIRASIATGENNWRTQRERMGGGLELLVATMGRLVGHLSPRGMEPSFELSGTRALVVDEASSLYQGHVPSWLSAKERAEEEEEHGGHGHHQQQQTLQEPPLAMWKWLRSELPSSTSTIMVTSALPEGVEEQIKEDVPNITIRVGRGLHMTRSNVALRVVDCSVPNGNQRNSYADALFALKLGELRDVLAESEHTLVICNTAASCERIDRALRADPFACGPSACPAKTLPPTTLTFHESLTPKKREAALDSFRRPTLNRWESRLVADAAEASGGSSTERPCRILLATGRAVRGLELNAGDERPIDHVVLFDFAPNAKSYLARVGCAKRGNQPAARVTSFAVGSQLAFAKALLAHDENGAEHELWAEERIM